jgi:hypothetical protein
VLKINIESETVYVLTLNRNNIDNVFDLSEQIQATNIDITDNDGVIKADISGIATGYNVEFPGSNYSLGDIASTMSVAGTGATGFVSELTKGSIERITVDDGGSGYSQGDRLYFLNDGTGGYNASAAVASVDGLGSILSVSIENKGAGYKKLPSVLAANSVTLTDVDTDTEYTLNETVTGSNSNAQGIVLDWNDTTNVLQVYKFTSESFSVGESVTGAESATTGLVVSTSGTSATFTLDGENYSEVATLVNGAASAGNYFINVDAGDIFTVGDTLRFGDATTLSTEGGGHTTKYRVHEISDNTLLFNDPLTAAVDDNSRIEKFNSAVGGIQKIQGFDFGSGYTDLPYEVTIKSDTGSEFRGMFNSGFVGPATTKLVVELDDTAVDIDDYYNNKQISIHYTLEDSLTELTIGELIVLTPEQLSELLVGKKTSTSNVIRRVADYDGETRIVTLDKALDVLPVGTADGYLIGSINVTPTGTHVGRYLDTGGHLSSNKKLQDNDVYQDFSYQIISLRGLNEYSKIVKDLLHPAGMKLINSIFAVPEGSTIDLTITTSTSGTKEFTPVLADYRHYVIDTTEDESPLDDGDTYLEVALDSQRIHPNNEDTRGVPEQYIFVDTIDNYGTTEADAFAIGHTITGDSNGATATIASWDSTTGQMGLIRVTGSFVGDTITSNKSVTASNVAFATLNVSSVAGFVGNVSGAFAVGDTVTGSLSSETATVAAWNKCGSIVYVTSASGPFTLGETITSSSSVTATVDSITDTGIPFCSIPLQYITKIRTNLFA